MKHQLADWGLSDRQIRQIEHYLQLLDKWNKVYNLTAVREPAHMLTHHILDSLSVIPALRRHTQGQPRRLLDVGSGAGLPGLILAIAMPELSVTCIDTVSKKAAFIRQAASELELSVFQAIHGRVEVWRDEPFDVVTSRAFASLVDFTQLTAAHLADDGVWLAMKGKRPDGEVHALPHTVQVFHVEQLDVPDLKAERCLVWMRPGLSHH